MQRQMNYYDDTIVFCVCDFKAVCCFSSQKQNSGGCTKKSIQPADIIKIINLFKTSVETI